MHTLCSPSHLFSALFIQSSRPLFIFALEITGQDTKWFLGWEEMADSWYKGLIKDSKFRLEKSRMLWCAENHSMHRTTPFLMTQAPSKPPEHYIPINMPLPHQPASEKWLVFSPTCKERWQILLAPEEWWGIQAAYESRELALSKVLTVPCESVRLCSLLSDLLVVWLSWLKELWWQGKIQYENEVCVPFNVQFLLDKMPSHITSTVNKWSMTYYRSELDSLHPWVLCFISKIPRERELYKISLQNNKHPL